MSSQGGVLPCLRDTRCFRAAFVASAMPTAEATAPPESRTKLRPLDGFETQLVQDPANLPVAAKSRQLMIAAFSDAARVCLRLSARKADITDNSERALAAGVRAGTTLVERFPDRTLIAWKAVR
jgi:hypothetical protein